jgi:hypothetical protein
MQLQVHYLSEILWTQSEEIDKNLLQISVNSFDEGTS